MDQSDFSFDAPLIATPASQITTRTMSDISEIISKLSDVLPTLPDDIDIDAPLRAIGMSDSAITGWHRARSMDVLIGDKYPVFQAYVVEQIAGALKIRYRRLPPLMPCPGYGDETCGSPTRGGKRCEKHAEVEAMDLYDQP